MNLTIEFDVMFLNIPVMQFFFMKYVLYTVK